MHLPFTCASLPGLYPFFGATVFSVWHCCACVSVAVLPPLFGGTTSCAAHFVSGHAYYIDHFVQVPVQIFIQNREMVVLMTRISALLLFMSGQRTLMELFIWNTVLYISAFTPMICTCHANNRVNIVAANIDQCISQIHFRYTYIFPPDIDVYTSMYVHIIFTYLYVSMSILHSSLYQVSIRYPRNSRVCVSVS